MCSLCGKVCAAHFLMEVIFLKHIFIFLCHPVNVICAEMCVFSCLGGLYVHSHGWRWAFLQYICVMLVCVCNGPCQTKPYQTTLLVGFPIQCAEQQ